MKLFIGILLIVLSTIVGYLFSLKYSERRVFFEDFNCLVTSLKNEINFTQRPVIDVINGCLNKNSDVLLVYNSFLIDKTDYTSNLKYLSFNEKKFVFNFLSSIGVGDSSSQIKIVDVAVEQSNSFLRQAVDDEKKYKTLFLKLGILAGITLFVLFI
jgi:stage III sporulation protein AB